MRERRYYVYTLSSKSRVIYVGMTGLLMSRVLQHRAGESGAFTRKYRMHRLVYFESFQMSRMRSRIGTEIKKWRREKKVELIRRENPTWQDLAAGRGKWVPVKVGEAGSLQVPHRSCRPIRSDNPECSGSRYLCGHLLLSAAE